MISAAAFSAGNVVTGRLIVGKDMRLCVQGSELQSRPQPRRYGKIMGNYSQPRTAVVCLQFFLLSRAEDPTDGQSPYLIHVSCHGNYFLDHLPQRFHKSPSTGLVTCGC